MKREHAPFGACPIPFPTTRWRVRILDFADADTLTVMIDRGFFQANAIDIRLADIDTWERYSGPAETRALGAAAWRWVMGACVERWGMLTTQMDSEKYGRILGTLEYLDGAGVFRDLSTELRSRGFEKTAMTPTASRGDPNGP